MVKPLIRPAPQRGYARTRGTPNSKKKEALIQDKIYLKYIRLKCKDIEKTVEFYQTLGMVVEYRVEETYKEDVAPGLINECVKTVVAITGENLNPQTMTLTGKQAFQALFDTTGNRSQLLFEHIKVFF